MNSPAQGAEAPAHSGCPGRAGQWRPNWGSRTQRIITVFSTSTRPPVRPLTSPTTSSTASASRTPGTTASTSRLLGVGSTTWSQQSPCWSSAGSSRVAMLLLLEDEGPLLVELDPTGVRGKKPPARRGAGGRGRRPTGLSGPRCCGSPSPAARLPWLARVAPAVRPGGMSSSGPGSRPGMPAACSRGPGSPSTARSAARSRGRWGGWMREQGRGRTPTPGPGRAAFPAEFDDLRVEWERAAWENAGDPAGEVAAKRAGPLAAARAARRPHRRNSQYEAAAAARRDLPTTRAALGYALARAGPARKASPGLPARRSGCVPSTR